ncbi:hypothetical protein H0H93_000844, partial [Arthromyces matolae]
GSRLHKDSTRLKGPEPLIKEKTNHHYPLDNMIRSGSLCTAESLIVLEVDLVLRDMSQTPQTLKKVLVELRIPKVSFRYGRSKHSCRTCYSSYAIPQVGTAWRSQPDLATPPLPTLRHTQLITEPEGPR